MPTGAVLLNLVNCPTAILNSPGFTVVEVAEVARVEEEVRSEKLPEAALARPEGQRGVQVQAAGPVRLSAQVVS